MKQTESISIRRPQAEVWTLVGDPEQLHQWSPDFEFLKIDGPVQVGARLSCKYRGRVVNARIEPFTDGATFGIRGVGKGYILRESISLAAQGDTTAVSLSMSFEPTALWAKAAAILIWPFKGLVLGRFLRKSLDRLKTLLEAA